MTGTPLSALVRSIPGARPLDPGDPLIRAISCDSRKVKPGTLFAAVRGAVRDGHRFVAEAAEQGALACLLEEELPAPGCVRVLVPDSETALGLASAVLWGHPSHRLRLVGVTGTNGKTTTSYLIQHILESFGERTGRLGTISYAFPSGESPAPLTTPDAPALQGALARMADEAVEAVVMEVSSHALHRQRVAGCRFACTAFTNLTQDHLDYHGTMDAYFEAKRLLFTQCAPDAPAVVNADDPFGVRLAAEVPGPVLRYGLAQGDLRLQVREMSVHGLRAEVFYPGGRTELSLPLVGDFNAYNAACALAVAHALGLDVAAAAAALSYAPQVPGRVERVVGSSPVTVLVDYAHTHDALDRMLESVRRLCRGRLWCVFGCGGDRDRGKRPLMAKAAARWCDMVVLTADNSRSEPTASILDEIEIGLPVGWRRDDALGNGSVCVHTYTRIEDRGSAIERALTAAAPGDTVVIAGKGHESTQTLGAQVLPFDDRAVARAVLDRGDAA